MCDSKSPDVPYFLLMRAIFEFLASSCVQDIVSHKEKKRKENAASDSDPSILVLTFNEKRPSVPDILILHIFPIDRRHIITCGSLWGPLVLHAAANTSVNFFRSQTLKLHKREGSRKGKINIPSFDSTDLKDRRKSGRNKGLIVPRFSHLLTSW